MSKRYFTWRFI